MWVATSKIIYIISNSIEVKKSFDALDIRIINAMREDATLGYSELAKKVRAPPTTVYQRIKRMKENDTIKKIVPIIDHEFFDYKLTVFILIGVSDIKEIERIGKELAKLDEVLESHHISGTTSILVKIKVKDSVDYRQFISEKIGAIRGIKDLHDFIAFNTFKEEPTVRLKL